MIFFQFFFSFLTGGKDCMLYRKIAFYIVRLPHQLFHLLWKLSRMSGGHLEKIGRPVVLENVSGGHFERRKKKRLLLPIFHRGRTLNMFFFLLCLTPMTNTNIKQTHSASICVVRRHQASLSLKTILVLFSVITCSPPHEADSWPQEAESASWGGLRPWAGFPYWAIP